MDAVASIDGVAAEDDQRGECPRVLNGMFATPVSLASRSRVLATAVNTVLQEMTADSRLRALFHRYGASRYTDPLVVGWPQALRIIIPPLGESLNGLLKTKSITSVISMEELLRRAQLLIRERFPVLELFMAAALHSLLMTTAWDLAQRRLEARYGRGYATDTGRR